MNMEKILVPLCFLFVPLFTLVYSHNETLQNPPPPLAHVEKCGSTQKMVDECFKDLPEPLVEFLQNTKVVVSKKEIFAKCK